MKTNIYPVIHYLDDETTIAQSVIAKSLGADGVFLISHIGSNERLPALAKRIKNTYPDFKVGINLLGESIIEAAYQAENYGLDMVWGDYCGVSSEGLTEEGEKLKQWQEETEIAVFASVAFKYQKAESSPEKAALEAQKAGFIPTTSGSGTGYAPTTEKIKVMSKATNGLLAVASGMSCDNVSIFKDYLSDILVATGVSKDENHFDIDKLARFISLVKNE